MGRLLAAFIVLGSTLLSQSAKAASCVAGDAGRSRYNASAGNMEYCSGSNWITMRNGYFSPCANTEAGKTRYVAAAGDMQFCNGTSWFSTYNAVVTTCSATDAGKMRWNSGTSNYQFCDGTNWNGTGVTLATTGFFVSGSDYMPGNIDIYGGGLAGANAYCVDQLNIYDWKGKSSAGSLTSARVRAFTCDESTCNNLLASTTYAFASAAIPSAGGATFTTDSSARGPNDSLDWSTSDHFGQSVQYWMGRALSGASTTRWATTSNAGKTCNGWTSWATTTVGASGVGGSTVKDRWYTADAACNNYQPFLCYVDPPQATPNPFTLIDQSGLTTSSLTTSNIVQITGLATSAAVGVSAGGGAQYRVCADATCSANPAWTSTAGSVANNQYLQARATTSANTGVSLPVQVTVGGAMDEWTLVTSGTATGYFVLVPSDDLGNNHSGSRIWMDQTCLGRLSNMAWKGQSEAGKLTTERVHTWACIYGYECQGLQPNTKYQFAATGSTTIGGSLFTTDANGFGPGNGTAWSGATYFGTSVNVATSRTPGAATLWNDSPSQNGDCNGWSDNTTSFSYEGGNTGATGTGRWSGTTATCDQTAYMICAVDPAPNFSLSFQPVTGVDLLTTTTSNIVSLAAMNANTTIYVDTIGYMQYRTCADSGCSSVVKNWSYVPSVLSSSTYLQLRMISSPYAGTTLTGNVYIGTAANAFKWSVTTAGTPANGYFVLSSAARNGNFGGLSGGASLCLSDLNANNWKGKSNAGTLNASRVRMFACDEAICNLPLGNSTYNAAVSNDTTAGGAPMSVDDGGYFPGVYQAWTSRTMFGTTYQYWTGYTWNSRVAAPQNLFLLDRRSEAKLPAAGLTCSNWTSGTSAFTATAGDSNNLDQKRFQSSVDTCDVTHRYVCLVDPLLNPTSFSFTNQTGIALSTLVTSNIQQVTGLSSPALVTLSAGLGDPNFRVCDDAACGTASAWLTDPRQIKSGQYLQLRLTSSAASARAAAATITVGAFSTTWTVTTADTCSHGNQTFTTNGATQTFTVPAGCGNLTIKTWGAGGGGANGAGAWAGGAGAFVTGTVAANPGDSLAVLVAAAGSTGATTKAGGTLGGGQGFTRGGAGGGASLVAFNDNTAELASGWTPRYANLISYLRLNGTGTPANGATLTAVVGPNGFFSNVDGGPSGYSSGIANQGLSFDGNDDRIRVPGLTGLDDAKQFTVSSWVFTNSLNDYMTWFDKSPSYTNQMLMESGAGADQAKLNLYMYTPSGRGSMRTLNNVLVPNKWQHLVLVFDGTQTANTDRVNVYVDGVKQLLVTSEGSELIPAFLDARPSVDFTWGAVGFQTYSTWPGTFDELAIWNVALNSSEVARVYGRQGPLMVAAGGGGGGVTSGANASVSQVGGAGGNATTAANGGAGDARAGRGATATAGGAAGSTSGTAGSRFAGGNGTAQNAGGGGGGAYGGGGGGNNGTTNSGGGGGGVSYLAPYVGSPSVTAGTGTTAGGNGDANYVGGTGTGGATGTSGGAGRVYISY